MRHSNKQKKTCSDFSLQELYSCETENGRLNSRGWGFKYY